MRLSQNQQNGYIVLYIYMYIYVLFVQQ